MASAILEHGGQHRTVARLRVGAIAFLVWLRRVLLPARVPRADIPDVIDLGEMRAMLSERVKTWTEEWRRQGLEEGLEQGVHLGEAKVLRRLLVRRFGPLPSWVDVRIAAADVEKLEAWAVQVLEAPTLEALFADQTDGESRQTEGTFLTDKPQEEKLSASSPYWMTPLRLPRAALGLNLGPRSTSAGPLLGPLRRGAVDTDRAELGDLPQMRADFCK